MFKNHTDPETLVTLQLGQSIVPLLSAFDVPVSVVLFQSQS